MLKCSLCVFVTPDNKVLCLLFLLVFFKYLFALSLNFNCADLFFIFKVAPC